MLKPHKYSKHPEFTNLEKFVWQGLNDIGRTMSNIKKQEDKTLDDNFKDNASINEPIWHTKSELDKYVAQRLGLKLETYGKDKSKNDLYKAIANAIGTLRKSNILIDGSRNKTRDTGRGLWRLDKTKLEGFESNNATREMKNKDYYSYGTVSPVYQRHKQNAFRKILFKEYCQCAFCRFAIPDYMIGAHIVPYMVMQKEDAANAMNPVNGLLLCRFCDVAFERGSITLEHDYEITISEYLHKQKNSIVKSWIKSIPDELEIKKDADYPPDPKYLKWKKKLLKKTKV